MSRAMVIPGCEASSPISVTLDNEELWREFYNVGTEMIISKGGRRLFPWISVTVRGLDPNLRYYVFIEMALAENSRFRYIQGWQKSGPADSLPVSRIHCHPESPAPGSSWLRGSIGFNKLKLTNNCSRMGTNQIQIASMHKYIPHLRIVPCGPDSPEPLWLYSYNVPLLLAEFFAVTAYQSELVTRMKIMNNPFAKGFRELKSRGQKDRHGKRKDCQSEERPLNLTTRPDRTGCISPPNLPSSLSGESDPESMPRGRRKSAASPVSDASATSSVHQTSHFPDTIPKRISTLDAVSAESDPEFETRRRRKSAISPVSSSSETSNAHQTSRFPNISVLHPGSAELDPESGLRKRRKSAASLVSDDSETSSVYRKPRFPDSTSLNISAVHPVSAESDPEFGMCRRQKSAISPVSVYSETSNTYHTSLFPDTTSPSASKCHPAIVDDPESGMRRRGESAISPVSDSSETSIGYQILRFPHTALQNTMYHMAVIPALNYPILWPNYPVPYLSRYGLLSSLY